MGAAGSGQTNSYGNSRSWTSSCHSGASFNDPGASSSSTSTGSSSGTVGVVTTCARPGVTVMSHAHSRATPFLVLSKAVVFISSPSAGSVGGRLPTWVFGLTHSSGRSGRRLSGLLPISAWVGLPRHHQGWVDLPMDGGSTSCFTCPAMRPNVDFRWALAGALATGLAIVALWPALPSRPLLVGVKAGKAPTVGALQRKDAQALAAAAVKVRRGTPVPRGEDERVKAALARDPHDIDARLDLARVYLARRELAAVWKETSYVLARSPGEPRALTYQALVRFAAGETGRAVVMLERVVQAAPELEEARRALVFVYGRTGRAADAAALSVEKSEALPAPPATPRSPRAPALAVRTTAARELPREFDRAGRPPAPRPRGARPGRHADGAAGTPNWGNAGRAPSRGTPPSGLA